MERIEGFAAIEYAEECGFTLNKYADPIEGARDGLSVGEALRVAAEDPSLIYLERVGCECGTATGECCAWSGPRSETVLIEWMPESLRASHTTAGVFPHNRAYRFRAHHECAAALLEADEWAALVKEG